ncbi:MAG TPA: FAD:protein FMN transferase [Candidatus Binatia bacterium]|nr:FAD:protein FMN transferase [Candidatus Binatia bacterium]
MLSFRSMGTEITVYAPSLSEAEEGGIASAVAEVFAESESRFSRFRADTELSRLNAAGAPTVVSPELFDVLRSARRYFELTGGLFDPTVGSALIALGYDRSFSPGALDRRSLAAPVPVCSFAEVVLDEATRTVHKPSHIRLDFGGLVKGRTADVAAELLPCLGVVDAGGDAVLRNGGSSGTGWIVDIEDPRNPGRTLLSLTVRDRAVATSGSNRRRWTVAGEVVHHLIDPRTWKPAASDLAQVTVVAPTAELAEVLAKTAFLLGARGGARFLDSIHGVAAVFVGLDTSIRRIGELKVSNA